MGAEPLLTVEEAFTARGPGVLLLPKITADRVPPGTFEVIVTTPGGAERRVPATADVAHMRGGLAPFAMVRLPTLAVEDVPPGSTVRLVA